MNKPKPKFTEIEEWQAKWEKLNDLEITSKASWSYARCLGGFWKYFRKYKRLSDLTRQDVYDYKIIRAREGATPSRIAREVGAVRTFYNWVIPASGLPLINPAAKIIRIDWP